MKVINRVLPFLFLVMLLAIPTYAQQGNIQGKVVDKDGKPLPGLTVSIDRQGISGHYEVKSDNKGSYFHAGLPTGVYKVSLMKEGQVLTFVDNVRVNFGATTPVDFDLSKVQAQPQVSAADKAKAEAEQKLQAEVKGSFDQGVAALQAKNYTEAARLLQEAAEKDPTKDVIYANLGEALSGAKKYDESADAYRKAIELKPSEYAYYNNLGIALGSAGKVEDAIQALQKAAELNPQNAPQAYYNLGALLTNRGRSKDAAEAFKKAIELNPTYAQAYLQLGISYIGSPDTMSEAIPVLEKFLTLNPSPTDADTAKQLIEAAKSSGASGFKSEKAQAEEKEKAEKEKQKQKKQR
jgi:Flp pilus assembly protein TadD